MTKHEKRNKSLRKQLIGLFLITGLIPTLLVSMILFNRISTIERTTSLSDTQAFSETIAIQLQEVFDNSLAVAETLAMNTNVEMVVPILNSTPVDSPNWHSTSQILLNAIPRIERELPQLYDDIFVAAGTTIVYNKKKTLTGDIATYGFVKEAFETKQPTWSPWIYAEELGHYVLYVVVPVIDSRRPDTVEGLVGLAIGQNQIHSVLHPTNDDALTSRNIYLVDQTGLLQSNTLTSQPDHQDIAASVIDTESVSMLAAALAANNFTYVGQAEYQSYHGRPVLGTIQSIPFGGGHVGLVIEVDVAEAYQGVFQARVLVFWVLGIVMLVIGLSSYILTNRIVRPIEMLVEVADKVASGDLSALADVGRKDEIGKLADAFNRMASNLKEIIQAINAVTANASAASQEMSASSEENSASLHQVVSSLSEFSHTLKDVNTNTQEMATKAMGVEKLAHSGTSQMDVTGETMLEILSSSKTAQKVISDLQSSANKISDVINLISAVAEQTNLLALNAAIEAARAGQHGRGFAVVADEVRKLAEQTQNSVGIIRHNVDELRQGTLSAVSVIDQNNTKVEGGVSALEKTKVDFNSITENISDTVQIISGVAGSAKQLEAGIGEISASAEQQVAAMDQLAATAESVAKLSEEMTKLISRFTM